MTSTQETATCPYPFSDARALRVDPAYARMRAEAPTVRVSLPHGADGWLATTYDDVRTVLGDPRFSRAATVGADVPRVRPEIDHEASSILNMDPPDHTRLRRLVMKAFTVRRVEQIRVRAAELTAQMLAGLRAAGPGADLVTHVSMPLPVTIICEMLGVPVEDRDVFRAGADAALSTTSMTPQERASSRDAMLAYMATLVAQRRERPTDDLLGALVSARDEEDRLSERELVGMGVGILVAGHETTMNMISNMTFQLLTRPDRGAALRDDPDAIAAGVEELLRFIPLGAAASFPRVATEEVVLPSGVTIPEGDAVLVSVHSANRDAGVFADPDELVLDRTENRHVAFGHGAHHCLGAPLARMELQEAVGGLLREFPDLRLAVPAEDVEWRTGALVRGPKSLPLAW